VKEHWKEWKVVGGSYGTDCGDGPGWYATCYFNTTTPGSAGWAELRAYRDEHGTTSWEAGPFETDSEAHGWVHEKNQELGSGPFNHAQTMEISSVMFEDQAKVDARKAWREENKAAFQDLLDELAEWEKTHTQGAGHEAVETTV
jgi:hypothetical protein